ncbi:MAG: tripartite tricarboxylate transporter substrate-binding protein [Xanthobacteraceae bacterium]
MLTRRRLLAASAAGLASTAIGGRASAQFLKKTSHLVIGFPAGGGTDVIGRVIADKLQGPYATAMIVENKPGAAARLSIEYIKGGDRDGSMMLFTPDFPLTIYPHSFKNLSYDPTRDLTAIGPTTRSLLTFNVGPAVPAEVKTIKDFLAWCQANPDKASYGTTSAGGTPHFIGVMLSTESGVKMTPVHYRGDAPATQDMLGGHIPAAIIPVASAMPLLQMPSFRVLAVTSNKRTKFLPDIPTLREQGFNIGHDSWLGIFGPPDMEPAAVKALSDELRTITSSQYFADRMAQFANEPMFESPEEFAARLKADIARWAPVVKASGFVAEE